MINRFINAIPLFLIMILGFSGCKSKINKLIDNKREGLWVTVDTFDYVYITKGRYKNDMEVGTWKHFNNGKLVRKEKYRNSLCKTKYFYPNGKLMKKGFTKVNVDNNEIHWFYFGKWSYYNENGKLDSIKDYKIDNKLDSLSNGKNNQTEHRFHE